MSWSVFSDLEPLFSDQDRFSENLRKIKDNVTDHQVLVEVTCHLRNEADMLWEFCHLQIG